MLVNNVGQNSERDLVRSQHVLLVGGDETTHGVLVADSKQDLLLVPEFFVWKLDHPICKAPTPHRIR